MKSLVRLVSPSVCRAPGEIVLRRASYSSSKKWVITNMCPARLSEVTPCGGSSLKQNIFEHAFTWYPIGHSIPNTTRNIKILNSSNFSETPGSTPTLRFAPPTLSFATRTFVRFSCFLALKRWYLTLAMQNGRICICRRHPVKSDIS